MVLFLALLDTGKVQGDIRELPAFYVVHCPAET